MFTMIFSNEPKTVSIMWSTCWRCPCMCVCVTLHTYMTIQLFMTIKSHIYIYSNYCSKPQHCLFFAVHPLLPFVQSPCWLFDPKQRNVPHIVCEACQNIGGCSLPVGYILTSGRWWYSRFVAGQRPIKWLFGSSWDLGPSRCLGPWSISSLDVSTTLRCHQTWVDGKFRKSPN